MSHDARLIATLRRRYRGILSDRVSDAVIVRAYFYWRLSGKGEQDFAWYVADARSALR
jgi:hypothetical protein